ncbi:MAG: ferrochelatase [Chloroflexota bacterium]|nr:MAG: ferrochelatase [Chloroflexota bacterium]
MKYLKWLVIALLAGILGVLFVQYLSVHPLQMSAYLFASLVVLFILVVVLVVGFKRTSLIIAILLALGLFVVGHITMTRIILARDDPRPVPELTRAPGDPGLGHTAVVYFTHGEPETFNPIGWINQFNEFDEQGIGFIPLFARPFFFNELRNKYLEVGTSNHRKMHEQMIASLEEAYRAEGDTTTKFYLSFLDDNPRPDAAAIQALNEGASKIVVSEVFLTISNHTAEGEHQIEELNIEETFDIPVEYTGPLYDSETLMSMFVNRANANIGDTDKSKVGILLVGHGQPDEWDIEWPTETEQELGFRYEVLDMLAADGYQPDNLSLAWMSFKEPKPAEMFEQFLQNDIEKLLFFSAAISADAMHSQYDIPELVHEADYPEGFPIINLGAWNDDPIVIQAIKEKIDPYMD